MTLYLFIFGEGDVRQCVKNYLAFFNIAINDFVRKHWLKD